MKKHRDSDSPFRARTGESVPHVRWASQTLESTAPAGYHDEELEHETASPAFMETCQEGNGRPEDDINSLLSLYDDGSIASLPGDSLRGRHRSSRECHVLIN
jgi:hypothetical protein